MFGLRRKKQKPKPARISAPIVSHSHEFTATFFCTHPWEYQAVRNCLLLAVARWPTLALARITGWNGHVVVVQLTIRVPWTAEGREAQLEQAHAEVVALITNMAIGPRLLYLSRAGRGRRASASWQQIADHPHIAELEEHYATYYGAADA